MTRADIDNIRRVLLGHYQGSPYARLSAREVRALDALDAEQPSDLPALDTAYPTQARDAGA